MKLNDYLEHKGIKPQEFADSMGVAMQSVYRWLNGERRPDWDLLPRLIELTDGEVTANDFVDWSESDCGSNEARP